MPEIAEHVFKLTHHNKWIAKVGSTYNIPLDNLFYWEQRCGNWAAMCQMEFDTAWNDIFTPFNCRNLLLDILSVDERYRKRPNHLLYRKIMKKLWPEVLKFPINPHTRYKYKNKTKLRSQLSRYIFSLIKKKKNK